MDHFSPSPNPKDFLNFEEYQKALKNHKEFHDRVKQVDALMENTADENEFQKGMEELGFTYHEDEKCGNNWCEEHGYCLSFMVEKFEYRANQDVFTGLLAEKDLIFDIPTGQLVTCSDIPKKWFDENSIEYATILAYDQSYTELLGYNFGEENFDEVLKFREDLQECMREMYFTLQTTLRGYAPEVIEEHGAKFVALLTQVFDLKFAKSIAEKWNF